MKNMSESNERNRLGDQIIKNHVMWSMGAGLIPFPIADLLAVTGIQLDMIRQLCQLYDVDFKDTRGKAIVSSLTGSSMARMGAQAVKFIPGIGSVVGGLTMSVLSGGTTYAIGHVFASHFETGGTLLDFDVERLKKVYDDLFEKGKEYASKIKEEEEVKKEKKTKPAVDKRDVVDKLKDLSELLDKGVISKSEFKKLKKKILG